MAGREKHAERYRRARAFQQLQKSVAAVDIYTPSPASLFEVLSKARLGESYAASIELARSQLCRASPEVDVPAELSETTTASHLARAAELYATAAAKCLRIPDPQRAYKYFHKAASLLRRAAALACDGGPALWRDSQAYRQRAALVRLKLARRCVWRRRLSLGLLRRSR